MSMDSQVLIREMERVQEMHAKRLDVIMQKAKEGVCNLFEDAARDMAVAREEACAARMRLRHVMEQEEARDAQQRVRDAEHRKEVEALKQEIASMRTVPSAKMGDTPIATAQSNLAVSWLVERRNLHTSLADSLGYATTDITTAEFIRLFLDSMPKKGDAPAQFYFTPIDMHGERIGGGKPCVIVSIPWDNAHLREARAKATS